MCSLKGSPCTIWGGSLCNILFQVHRVTLQMAQIARSGLLSEYPYQVRQSNELYLSNCAADDPHNVALAPSPARLLSVCHAHTLAVSRANLNHLCTRLWVLMEVSLIMWAAP